jgi:hypothetical protein
VWDDENEDEILTVPGPIMMTGVRGFVGRRKVERRTWTGTLYMVSALYEPRGPSTAYTGFETMAGFESAGAATSGASTSVGLAENLTLRR